MTRDEYYAYLKTPAWQEKRSKRLVIDDFTCQRCGERKTKLDVHHINYDRVGEEDVYRDLITLCRDCHEIIEYKKKEKNDEPIREPKPFDLSKIAALRFCEEHCEQDYSFGGDKNYCNISVVKPELEQWLSKNGYYDAWPCVKVCLDYFSAERYGVILWRLSEGKSATWIERKYKFKRKMIDKVKSNDQGAIVRMFNWRMDQKKIRADYDDWMRNAENMAGEKPPFAGMETLTGRKADVPL